MSYSLSITRQAKLRGAVTMTPANYSLPGQPQPTNEGPVAYFSTTGMSDGTCPWVDSDLGKRGGKYCVLAHAENNGCTIPGNIQTVMTGSKAILCYEAKGKGVVDGVKDDRLCDQWLDTEHSAVSHAHSVDELG